MEKLSLIHGGDIYGNKIEYDFSVNTNPYGCPQAVLEAIRTSLNDISHYPDSEQRRARESLAELEGVSAENVFCGNGASELIMAVVRAVNSRKALLISPGFYGYRHALNSCEDLKVIEYFLQDRDDLGTGRCFEIEEDILDLITEETDMVFLTNPNNPTGKNIDPTILEKILLHCKEKKCAVVLDECFLRLSEPQSFNGIDCFNSFKKEIKRFPNLYVIDAFTKLFAVPGIRAGYVISSEENINNLRKHLPEWNLSIPAETLIVSGSKELLKTELLNSEEMCANLSCSNFLEKSRTLIKKERDFLKNELQKITSEKSEKSDNREIIVYDSDTCFLLFKLSGSLSEINLYEALLKRKILIRDCSNFSGLGKGWYRIAIKSHSENEHLISEVKKILNV